MKIHELETPAILVRSHILARNLRRYQEDCSRAGKELWPMVKTHKSTRMAAMQLALGATGFLCGTLDECEALADMGVPVMYAYPVAGEVSCRRAAALAKKCDFYVRLDGADAAQQLHNAAEAADAEISYTVIVDCGLHRFGIAPQSVVPLVRELQPYPRLRFAGISTHSGHVYGEADPACVPRYAQDERSALGAAAADLRAAGFVPRLITSGSTPTFRDALGDENINVFHPGNYVFHDGIQIANKTAEEGDCALTVYATIIAHPSESLLICDAGAKCLGLDLGAHGNASVRGHGWVIGHPEIEVAHLSEEVGQLHVTGETSLKVGDRIEIIPNHACSSANLTDWFVMVDERDEVTDHIAVDLRSNRTKKQ